MERPTKEQLYGAAGTVVFHIVVAVIMLLLVMARPPQQEETGVPVVMGNTIASSGDSYQYTEVTAAPRPSEATTVPEPSPSAEEPLITQEDEPSAQLPTAENPKDEAREEKPSQPTTAELQAREAERLRQEAERLAREAEAKIAGAFGKGATMNNKGNSDEGKGNEGSPDGNDIQGVTTGVGGYGTWDLNGRTIGQGGLPRPEYNVQDEGRVVVTITVNPEGRVIKTDINPRTNTTNPALRQAALRAASQALFNRIDGLNNQMGTITYYFQLK